MKILYCWLLTLPILVFSCSNKDQITSEEVSFILKRFDEGWKNKNPVLVDSVLSDKYVYFTQSGGTFARENVVKTAGSSDYKLDLMERNEIWVQISGNTAIVNTTWRGKGLYFGKPFDDLQRCSVTIIKKGGKLEILSEHCTPLK